jgi:hypothetical protein
MLDVRFRPGMLFAVLEALAQQAGEAGKGFQCRVAELHQLGDALVAAHEIGQALAEDHQLVAFLAVLRALHIGVLHALLVTAIVGSLPSLFPLVDGVVEALQLAIEAAGGCLGQAVEPLAGC